MTQSASSAVVQPVACRLNSAVTGLECRCEELQQRLDQERAAAARAGRSGANSGDLAWPESGYSSALSVELGEEGGSGGESRRESGESGPGCSLLWDAAEHLTLLASEEASPTTQPVPPCPVWQRELEAEVCGLREENSRLAGQLEVVQAEAEREWRTGPHCPACLSLSHCAEGGWRQLALQAALLLPSQSRPWLDTVLASLLLLAGILAALQPLL